MKISSAALAPLEELSSSRGLRADGTGWGCPLRSLKGQSGLVLSPLLQGTEELVGMAALGSKISTPSSAGGET